MHRFKKLVQFIPHSGLLAPILVGMFLFFIPSLAAGALVWQDGGEDDVEFENFGMNLKGAVRDGSMGEEDAWLLWTFVSETYGSAGDAGGAEAAQKTQEYLLEVEAKIHAMVEAGTLSPADADAKMTAVRESAMQGSKSGVGNMAGRLGGELERNGYFRMTDLPVFVRTLELDEGQTLLTEALLDGFQFGHARWYADASEMLRAEQRAIRAKVGEPGASFQNWQRTLMKISNLIREFNLEKKQAERSFAENLQSFLSSEQRSQWPRAEREIRRLRTISEGRFSGESSDLIALLDKLEIRTEGNSKLASALEGYANALNEALVARNDFLENRMNSIGELIQEMDVERVSALANREARLRVGVRDTNEQWMPVIAGQLDEKASAQFRSEYLKQAYRRIYLPLSTQQAFERVKEMALTGKILHSVVQLETAFVSEIEVQNGNVVQLTQEQERHEAVMRYERKVSGTKSEGRAEALRVAYAQRRDVNSRYRDLLEMLLTPDQISLLPAGPQTVEARMRMERKKETVLKQRNNGTKEKGGGK